MQCDPRGVGECVDLPELSDRDLGVDLSGVDLGVPEELLDEAGDRHRRSRIDGHLAWPGHPLPAWAFAYTLIETAKLNDVDPQDWLTWVLARIADQKIIHLGQLLPWRYAASTA